MKDKYLVTGVAGFIGSCIAARLLAEGKSVVGIDDLSTGNRANVPSGVEFIEDDLVSCDYTDIKWTDIGVVMHLAGQSSGEISFDNPVRDLELNTVTTLRLAEQAKRHNVRRFMYASSMAAYGLKDEKPIGESESLDPVSCYGVGKAAAEAYLRILLRERAVCLRMFNVYGSGQDMENMRQGMVSIFVSQFMRQNTIVVKGALERFRDFIYIDDVVDIWTTLAERSDVYGPVNLCTGVKTTVQDLLEELQSVLGRREIVVVDGTPGDQSGIYGDDTLVKTYRKNSNWTDLATGLGRMLRDLDGFN